MRAMQEPINDQTRCWVGWQRCEENGVGVRRGCRWNRVAREVAIALLYVSSTATEVQAWVEGDTDFTDKAEHDGQETLEEFLKGRVDWDGVESNRRCELIWRFG